jgi:N-acetylglucosaminyldiphosphoundecaprenol N-acetyl-beta-D-mannosaminyltransferase
MLKKKRLIAIDISRGTYKEFVSAILSFAKAKTSSYVCVANVHMVMEAYENPHFATIVNNADLVTPDGMPLTKAIKAIYNEDQERVDGMSLLPILLSESEKNDFSVYFYGSSQKLLDDTSKHLSVHYPKLKVAGLYSPPFRKLTPEEDKEVEEKITASGANIVFAVLGCPKQETWMASMKGKIPAVMLGIGGALPVLVGQQKRAPIWMQKNSLEWLYRLAQEPSRLFKRYFKTNTMFLYLMAKEKLKIK